MPWPLNHVTQSAPLALLPQVSIDEPVPSIWCTGKLGTSHQSATFARLHGFPAIDLAVGYLAYVCLMVNP